MIAESCSLILIANQGTNVYFHHSWYVYRAILAIFIKTTTINFNIDFSIEAQLLIRGNSSFLCLTLPL